MYICLNRHTHTHTHLDTRTASQSDTNMQVFFQTFFASLLPKLYLCKCIEMLLLVRVRTRSWVEPATFVQLPVAAIKLNCSRWATSRHFHHQRPALCMAKVANFVLYISTLQIGLFFVGCRHGFSLERSFKKSEDRFAFNCTWTADECRKVDVDRGRKSCKNIRELLLNIKQAAK